MSEAYEIVKAHYAASDRGDLEGMIAPFAPGIRWTEMEGFPYAGTYEGPEAVRKGVFERLGGEWDGYTASVERVLDAGDGTVVGIGTYSGTFRATGRSMSARFVHVWQVEDGQVVKFEQFTDTALVRDALG